MNQFINQPKSPLKPVKQSLWQRLRWRNLTKKQKVALVVIPILILIISGAVLIALMSRAEETVATVDPSPKPKPTIVPHLINGVMVSPEIANRHAVAVMIENSPAARPQVGLTKADLVYEAVTEGGITRFMGIYSQNYPTKAGPVRSARSYFIDWLTDYDAFYAHAGGSPTALGRITEYGIKDYPHNNDSYHREPKAGVSSEHTLFVDVAKIFQFGVEKKKWPATYDTLSWQFKDEDPAALAAASAGTATPPPNPTVTINFSSPQFKVIWKYDQTTNLYSREMGGSPHLDRESSEQIKAKTVIVMKVNHSPNAKYNTGKESEWTMSNLGEGAMSVYEDGALINGKWKKPARLDRLRFYDEAGLEVKLNRGQIWIEVVPQEGSVS